MELLIVTGMSGAGKSQAVHALEDIGFYCVDNIPPMLIRPFVDLSSRGGSELEKVAMITDVRGGALFQDVSRVLQELREHNVSFKILFLDATDEVLIRRYKENRRRHPLCDTQNVSIAQAVRRERELLRVLRDQADFVLDTSQTSIAQLKQNLFNIFLGDISQGLNIQCMSFGFKYGAATEADLVFDVRCLPNPYYIDELRPLTGLDDAIQEYVMDSEVSKGYMERLMSLIDFCVPLYCNEGKSQLVVAIGCTGGKHRSVTFAELIYKHLKDKGYRVSVNHRDISKA